MLYPKPCSKETNIPKTQQALPGNPQATATREACGLTADIHLYLCSSKCNPAFLSPALQQISCCSPHSPIPPSLVNQRDLPVTCPTPTPNTLIDLSQAPTVAGIPWKLAGHFNQQSMQAICTSLLHPSSPIPCQTPRLCIRQHDGSSPHSIPTSTCYCINPFKTSCFIPTCGLLQLQSQPNFIAKSQAQCLLIFAQNLQWTQLSGFQKNFLPRHIQGPHFPNKQRGKQTRNKKIPIQQTQGQISTCRLTTVPNPDTRCHHENTINNSHYSMSP